MGTHPIFESDFDCLTEAQIENGLVTIGLAFGRGQTGKARIAAPFPPRQFHLAPTSPPSKVDGAYGRGHAAKDDYGNHKLASESGSGTR